ncbi:hypothetical protein Emag_005644 [Eimeria magna]
MTASFNVDASCCCCNPLYKPQQQKHQQQQQQQQQQRMPWLPPPPWGLHGCRARGGPAASLQRLQQQPQLQQPPQQQQQQLLQASIRVTELSSKVVRFTLSNCDASIANALRRVMISEVPTLAIDLVTVYENTTVLHDEYIGFVLLYLLHPCFLLLLLLLQQCLCSDHCERCSVQYTLDATAADCDTLLVTHLDLTAEHGIGTYGGGPGGGLGGPPMPVPSPQEMQAEGIATGIPIVKLRKNQSLSMSCLATKWPPTSPVVKKQHPPLSSLSLSLWAACMLAVYVQHMRTHAFIGLQRCLHMRVVFIHSKYGARWVGACTAYLRCTYT